MQSNEKSSVVPFPTPVAKKCGQNPCGVNAPEKCCSPERRFSVGDRVIVHAWSVEASLCGIGRVAFERAEGPEHPEAADFILIYLRDNAWARWGIGCGPDGFMLWQADRGQTIGVYRDVRDALDEVLALVRQAAV